MSGVGRQRNTSGALLLQFSLHILGRTQYMTINPLSCPGAQVPLLDESTSCIAPKVLTLSYMLPWTLWRSVRSKRSKGYLPQVF